MEPPLSPTISRTVELPVAPAVVWSVVTDLPSMGELSPENAGGRWGPGHDGPAVGATFDGVNRNGAKQWRTRAHVVACEPERLFLFEVRTPFGMTTSRWSYELAATGSGCRLTESWYRVGNRVMRRVVGPLFTGRWDRPAFTAHSIEHTLAAIEAKVCRTHPHPASRTTSP